MAGGFMVDGKPGRAELYEGKVTVYVVFACMVAALGGSLFGYDLGVSGRSHLVLTLYVISSLHLVLVGTIPMFPMASFWSS